MYDCICSRNDDYSQDVPKMCGQTQGLSHLNAIQQSNSFEVITSFRQILIRKYSLYTFRGKYVNFGQIEIKMRISWPKTLTKTSQEFSNTKPPL